LATALGIVLYIASGLPFLFGGLIMPGYAVIGLAVVWLIGLVVVIRWRERRPLFFALPFVMLGLWFTVAWVGENFLGWSA